MMSGCDGSGTIRIWDGEEWQKSACAGCANCPNFNQQAEIINDHAMKLMNPRHMDEVYNAQAAVYAQANGFDKPDTEYYADGAAQLAAAMQRNAETVQGMLKTLNDKMEEQRTMPNRADRRRRNRRFRYQR